MITVTVIETGDTAEAVTPDEALFAALTIGREAKKHAGMHGFDPAIRFEHGDTVRVLTLRALTR